MKNLYERVRGFRLPHKKQINMVLASFSGREWWVFAGLTAVLFLSTLFILSSINRHFMISIPFHAGEMSEGVIGVPRFVNPVLASSDVDQDLTTLIYSGLMRKKPDGTLIPDLALEYEMEKNGLTYIFTLRDNLYFHDGKPLSVEDIIFTLGKVRETVIKSPRKVAWDGVTFEKISDKVIRFNLKQPYASFLENATLGILPAHIWKSSPIELNTANTAPIGSGPYMIEGADKQDSGGIASYKLKAFPDFALGEPYIERVNISFYSNENDLMQALEDGEVEQISSINPENAQGLKNKNYRIYSAVLPRIFGLFFNQNQNRIFLDKKVVKAIEDAIDKDRIVSEVLFGYGIKIEGPIPPNIFSYQKMNRKNGLPREEIIKNIRTDLEKDGWKIGTDGFFEKMNKTKKNAKSAAGAKSNTQGSQKLEFSISTGNARELTQTANLIKADLQKVGIKVEVKTFETGNLNQGVIRPRKYDALLFGQIINNESDLFAFWHSTQRKDPGLNISLYTNAKVDKLLEEAFVTADRTSRTKKYAQFEEEIKKDMPAVFLYSPSFIYVVSKNLKGFSVGKVVSPADRFLDVYKWYSETEDVWKIFY